MEIRKPTKFSACLAIATVLIVSVTSGGQDAGLAVSMLNHAQQLMDDSETLFNLGHYAEAASAAEGALTIRENHLGPNHLDTAAAMARAGLYERYIANYPRAKDLLKRALAARQKTLGADHVATAASLNDLGAYYHVMNDYPTAESFYHQALRVREKTLGENHIDTIRTLANLGVINTLIGRNAQAEQYFMRAIGGLDRSNRHSSPEGTRILSQLGELYTNTEEYSKAEPLLQRAYKDAERYFGPSHPETALALIGLGILYYKTGAYELSEEVFCRPKDLFESLFASDHPFVATTELWLGLISSRKGAYELAETHLRRALDLTEQTLGSESLEYSYDLNNLAEVKIATGHYESAEPLLLRSIAIKRKFISQEEENLAASFHNLGMLHFKLGAADRAQTFFDRALAIRQRVLGPSHPLTAETLSAVAALKWDSGEFDVAFNRLQAAQRIDEKNSSQILLFGSESRKEDYLKKFVREMHKHVTFSIEHPSAQTATLGFSSVLQYKGRVLDSMTENSAALRLSMLPADRALFDERARVATELANLTYRDSALSTLEYRRRTVELANAKEKLEATLAERSVEFQQSVSPLQVPEVRNAIPGNGLLVEWIRYLPFDPKSTTINGMQTPTSATSRYAAYLISRDLGPAVVDVGDALSIDAAVYELRYALNAHSTRSIESLTKTLSEKLLTPLYPFMRGKGHLIISPDGALNLLPLSALLDTKGDYLARNFELSYVTSGRDLLRTVPDSRQMASSVLVADPSFGTIEWHSRSASQTALTRSAELDRSGLIFRKLENTATEVQNIRKVLRDGSAEVLLGDDATEARLKRVHSPRILHIATHGFFLSDQDSDLDAIAFNVAAKTRENPLLRSGIALTGANARQSGPGEDGILTALEASQLDLHNTELVVLSACDSGVGEIKNGEGVYGLRRALVLAGAQTQVTSLWKVSDEATRILMVDFYERLQRGEGRSEALRHAQLDLLVKPEFSDPYYWASFIPIGNWKPLSTLH